MDTEILRINGEKPEPEHIARAAEILRRGGLVAFPTETVYGLGANALDPAAVARIFEAKGRPVNNPVIVHVATLDEAKRLTADWPAAAEILTAQFWPGPLALVLPKRPIVPDITTAGGATVALRMPAHPVALGLIKEAGLPVAAPSANPSSRLSPTTADHVLRALMGKIELILDGGPTAGGLESTVLDLTRTPPRLLRPGLVSAEEIEKMIGLISRPILRTDNESGPMPSPGMLPRHYAPRARLECIQGSGRQRVEMLMGAGRRVGWLMLTQGKGGDCPASASKMVVVHMPAEPIAYAAQLYASLLALDAAGVDEIIVDMPPDTPEWLAVRDRLSRAHDRTSERET
jgi:L-threonylcarbamoyladenylate synthase